MEDRLFATDWYEDITPQLKSHARNLGAGGVALAPHTKMYDALPAFQIGTPKVDTGSPTEFRTLDSELAAATEKYPLNDDVAMAAFMDELLSAEMAWHTGFSLLQTLLSCLYVEHELRQYTTASVMAAGEVATLKRQVSQSITGSAATGGNIVKAYVYSVIKAAGMAMDLVDTSGAPAVYPEEDFHTMRYNLNFLDEIPVQDVVELVEQAKKQAVHAGYTKCAERLAMRITWLTVLKQRVPKKLANLDNLDHQLSLRNNNPLNNGALNNAAVWFSTGCQSRLDMACLRQSVQRFSSAECTETFLKLINGIRQLVAVYKVERSVDLLGVFLAFSSRRELPVVRAMARSLASDTQILANSAKTWCLMDINETMPVPFAKKPRPPILEVFLHQASLCYLDLLTVFCQNRCRMREGLAALVVSFDSLQVSAGQTDTELANTTTTSAGGDTLVGEDGTKVPAMYLSSWTYFRKLQVMLWMVLLSFETGILGYGERAYTNWYASKLCQNLLAQLGRMRAAFEQHGNRARESPGFSFLVALELESQMLLQMSTAQYMLWIALHKLNPPSANPHVSRNMQFKLRFQSFEQVGVPEMHSLDEFDELASSLDITTALKAAGSSTQSVRNMLSTLTNLADDNAELPLLMRSAVGVAVAVATTIKLGHSPVDVEVQSEGFHWYFPVPKVTKRMASQ